MESYIVFVFDIIKMSTLLLTRSSNNSDLFLIKSIFKLAYINLFKLSTLMVLKTLLQLSCLVSAKKDTLE